MAEEIPSLHIDTDWKKQAQEEKRKLAEQAAAKPAAPVPAPAAPRSVTGPAATTGASSSGARGRRRELPPAGFAGLVQSVMTQTLFYLGEIATAAGGGSVDLDMARHHLDMLSMLEEKTANNLTAEEQNLLNSALYETRSRFVSVASQFLGP